MTKTTSTCTAHADEIASYLLPTLVPGPCSWTDSLCYQHVIRVQRIVHGARKEVDIGHSDSLVALDSCGPSNNPDFDDCPLLLPLLSFSRMPATSVNLMTFAN